MVSKLFRLIAGAPTRFRAMVTVLLCLSCLSLPAFASEPEAEETVMAEASDAEMASVQSENDLPRNGALETQDAPSPLADSSEDLNYILIEKQFSGLPAELIPDGFQVTVTSEPGRVYQLRPEDTISRTTDADGHVIWRWKLNGVGMGRYTVSESGEAVENYTVISSGAGTVEVKAAEMAVSVPFHETTCSHTNWPVKVDGDSNVLFAATLTQGGVAVISRSSLSAS